MHRIDNSTATTTLPAQKPQGNPGFFTSGSIGGESATIVEADFLNALQEEICTVITNAGLALVKGDQTQLWQALLRLTVPAPAVPHGRQPFSGSGTFIVPTGVARLTVRAWAGGGGGGGAVSGGALSASGAGGEYREGAFAVTPGAALAVTIGASGAGGSTAPTGGGAGGDTVLGDGAGGTLMRCKGGGAGGPATAPGVVYTYGAGGSGGTGGYVAFSGTFGGFGAVGASSVFVPPGGAAFCSPSPPPNVGNNAPGGNIPGSMGYFPGAGGAGSFGSGAATAGAPGAAGFLIIEW